MPLNSLKLNDDKTEFLPIHSKFLKSTSETPIQIGEVIVDPTPLARNLGIVFDNAHTLKPHINSVWKSAYFHICHVSQTRKQHTLKATKIIVHSLNLSRLDYCNTILPGLPECKFSKLQSVQNAAAKLITRSHKYDHVTPIL